MVGLGKHTEKRGKKRKLDNKNGRLHFHVLFGRGFSIQFSAGKSLNNPHFYVFHQTGKVKKKLIVSIKVGNSFVQKPRATGGRGEREKT